MTTKVSWRTRYIGSAVACIVGAFILVVAVRAIGSEGDWAGAIPSAALAAAVCAVGAWAGLAYIERATREKNGWDQRDLPAMRRAMRTGEDPGAELRQLVIDHVHRTRHVGMVALLVGGTLAVAVVLVAFLVTGWSSALVLPLIAAGGLLMIGIRSRRLHSPNP